jgi:hypothetical protein
MLFLLVAKDEHDFDAAVATHYPEDHFKFGPGQWVISTADTPTSKDVWDRLAGTSSSTGILVAFSGYYGRQSNALWEWIAAKRIAQK